MPLNIATNVSFEDEDEGDAVDSKANDNVIADAVKTTKVMNSHVKQDATDDVVLPPAAEYSDIWIYLRHGFSH
ncbi:hypothetical protein MAM1_0234d08474 [Mucor ambiguus]|uniref:Uncharacterized protein n=1 Tax=Mucor ambiguus TaxID=91626 RepID=A0A0C9MN94_9FUNG|nr:hypothetical protein MAM1_0234d08474 [Mucor ambiguus]